MRILRYMDEHNLNEDAFYITLCMDLKVSIDSIGSKNAELYISSRITSQGRQETYTCDVVDQPEVEICLPQFRHRLTRQTNMPIDDKYDDQNQNQNQNQYDDLDLDLDLDLNQDDINDDLNQHEDLDDTQLINRFNLSNRNNLQSPYSTPQQVGIMRGVSGGTPSEEKDDY